MKYLSSIPGIVGTAVAYWILTWFMPPYVAILSISVIIAASLYTLLENKARLMHFSAISFASSIAAIYLAVAAIIAGKFVWPILAIMVAVVILLVSWLSYKDNFDKLNIKGWSLKPILYCIVILALMIYLAPKIFPIPPRLAGLNKF